ncbi:putative carboxy-cis,cis-muconate cyclase [Halenospora varia]|nr:putative carboxy-cis,cis-muconate cyclase [Halenospora varia]
MRFSPPSLAILALSKLAKCDIHHLIAGTFGTTNLYTLEFDDVALTLNMIANTSTAVASSWIALSHDKKNLYGTSYSSASPAFVSYSLENATDISYTSTLPLGGNCTSSKAIFVMASTSPPYAVYGSPFGGSAPCGSVMGVDSSGALSTIVQNYTYGTTSGVHGMAMNANGSVLYSADDTGNALWTHSVDGETGEVTLVSSFAGPVAGSDPRHVSVHPVGKYLYVVLEGANQLAQYSIDQSNGVPSFGNKTWPLVPAGSSNSAYWSDEVALSYSNSYLWATSRARSSNSTGFISTFSLSSDGAIQEQLFLNATTNSGGTANSVAPSTFSDRFAALTDSSVGFVEIWELAIDGKNASVVAKVMLEDGGCCANAVWYS